MKKTWLMVMSLILVSTVCTCKQEPNSSYMEEVESVVKEYNAAALQAHQNNPVGYLKIYEIARNDNNKYPDEYSSVAGDDLFNLLYSNAELWIRTFSKIDVEKFKDFVKRHGIEVATLPEGVSNEQFKETIFRNLEKIKGDKKEMELVDYILGLYNKKRR